MNSRVTLHDARFFTDLRPFCVIENELKDRLGANTLEEYKSKLQRDGYTWYELTRPWQQGGVPKAFPEQSSGHLPHLQK